MAKALLHPECGRRARLGKSSQVALKKPAVHRLRLRFALEAGAKGGGLLADRSPKEPDPHQGANHERRRGGEDERRILRGEPASALDERQIGWEVDEDRERPRPLGCCGRDQGRSGQFQIRSTG